MTVLSITSVKDLTEYQSQWRDLSNHVVEPNIFYEPELLLPALKLFNRNGVELILVFTEDSSLETERKLIGLVPLKRSKRFLPFPITTTSTWEYPHCYLCVPLVRTAYQNEFFRQLINWCGNSASTLCLRYFPTDGILGDSISEVLSNSDSHLLTAPVRERALLVGNQCPEKYLESVLIKKRRKEQGRLRRRLSEMGDFRVETLDQKADVEPWIEQFLSLEKQGWKGVQGTSIASSELDHDFFSSALRSAHQAQKLFMLRMTIEDLPIAMKCNFISGSGAFAFKIAYDEKFHQYSPGILLEVENIYKTLSDPRISWMDSCARHDHEMINRLWRDRRKLGELEISLMHGWRGLRTDLYLNLKQVSRQFKRRVAYAT